MSFTRIGHKILAVVGIAVTVGLIGTAAFYTQQQEESILAQNERTIHKLADSVGAALQSVMLAGYADIAQAFAERLKQVDQVEDFRILRIDGNEAFRDNATIDDVNRRRGEEIFLPRDEEEVIPIISPSDVNLAKVLAEQQPTPYYETDGQGHRRLVFLYPMLNNEACYKCHGKAEPVRGVIKLATSLAPVESDILRTRERSFYIVGSAIMLTLLLTGYMIGRSVTAPIARVTTAMRAAAGGELDHRVPITGRDELSQMASSFNVMTSELKRSYSGLKLEQDKLTTIIHSANEGMVVTDADGGVVLVNPAAERLLGKSGERIVREGFLQIFDDPEKLMHRLQDGSGEDHEPILFNQRALEVQAATIRDAEGAVVGSACLIRDITEQKRLEDELRMLSTTDGLTGLFNRRHLDDSLSQELQRSRRYQLPLAILMFDVDHFKRFNDEHGHDTGDRVLRVLAKTLRGALRNHDLPCRYGGEEFLAILPSTDVDGAMAVAERLRAEVEALVVDGLRVTISIGVAGVPDLAVDTPERLVEMADAALYAAKRGGRNRVVRAVEGQEPAK